MTQKRITHAALGLAILVGIWTPAAVVSAQASIACEAGGPTANLRGDRWAPVRVGNDTHIKTRNGTEAMTYWVEEAVGGLSQSTTRSDIQAGFDEIAGTTCGSVDGSSNGAANVPPATRRDDEDAPANEYDSKIYNVDNWDGFFDDPSTTDVVESVDEDTVAITWNSSVDGSGIVVQAGIMFNAQYYEFRSPGDSGSCTEGDGGEPCYDFASVVLHELGHWYGLNHVMCPDAVMIGPEVERDESWTVNGLSDNEIAGFCALYPPRGNPDCDAGSDCRAFGEGCANNNQCETDSCLEMDEGVWGNEMGWCSVPCSTNADCGYGYTCGRTIDEANGGFDAGLNCLPDSQGMVEDCGCDADPESCDTGCSCNPQCTAEAGGGGVPEADSLAEFCTPCLSSDDCESGICVTEGVEGDYGLCPAICNPEGSGNGGCPTGFSCLDFLDDGICWPDDAETCDESSSGLGSLDELCYVSSGEGTWYNPCAPGLVCFGFRPQCAGQAGECVQYCDGNTACPDGMTCCTEVDDEGHCSPASGSVAGGCFDIRVRGQTCVEAEHSLCATGDGCYAPLGAAPRCYQECDAENACDEGASCYEFAELNADQSVCRAFGLCCRDGVNGNVDCQPFPDIPFSGLGVACETASECDSRNCAINPEAPELGGLCSRGCNPATGLGCPSLDSDVNGDGQPDGVFECVPLGDNPQDGRCFPVSGAIDRYIPDTSLYVPEGGCCGAHGMTASQLLFNGWPWMMLFGWSRWRRRSARRSPRS